MNGGSHFGIRVQHLIYQIPQSLRVWWTDWREWPLEDLQCQSIHWLGIECMAQIAHLIQTTPKCPYITLITVWLIFKQLRTHIVWSTNASICQIPRWVQYLSNSKITQPHPAILQENVLCLQIPMQNLLLMQVIECQCHLSKPI